MYADWPIIRRVGLVPDALRPGRSGKYLHRNRYPRFGQLVGANRGLFD